MKKRRFKLNFKNNKVNFELLAQRFMFSRSKIYNIVKEFKLQYRKNKGNADLYKAFQKAIKNGMGKTEYELSMFEIYLKDIFKLTKKEN